MAASSRAFSNKPFGGNTMIKKFFIPVAALMAVLALSGCQSSRDAFKGTTSNAPARTVIAKMAKIQSLQPVLACVRPAMAGKTVAITTATDNTGKTNSVADAGTGNFLPGAMSTNIAIPTLKAAGAQVMSLNSVAGESVLRQLVTPGKLGQMQKTTTRFAPDLYLDTASMSLDFDRTSNFALMIKGFGGYSDTQRATISGGAKLVRADGSLIVDGYSDLKLSVFSTQSGVMLGRVFGNTLASGEAGAGFQQPIQAWTLEYITQLATAGAMVDLSGNPRCQSMYDKIVKPDLVNL